MLGDADELVRHDHAAVGCRPSHEGLRAAQLTRRQLDERLVVHLELAAVDGRTQLSDEREASRAVVVALGSIELHPDLVGLRRVHRDVCVAEEPDRVGVGTLRRGDADARRDLDVDVCDHVRAAELGQQAVGQSAQLLRRGRRAHDDRELVAAESCDEVVLAHHLGHPATGLDEEEVAVVVAERVVHVLEAIEVDEEDRHLGAIGQQRVDRLLDDLSVGEPGEAVVRRKVLVARALRLEAVDELDVAERDGGVERERAEERDVVGVERPDGATAIRNHERHGVRRIGRGQAGRDRLRVAVAGQLDRAVLQSSEEEGVRICVESIEDECVDRLDVVVVRLTVDDDDPMAPGRAAAEDPCGLGMQHLGRPRQQDRDHLTGEHRFAQLLVQLVQALDLAVPRGHGRERAQEQDDEGPDTDHQPGGRLVELHQGDDDERQGHVGQGRQHAEAEPAEEGWLEAVLVDADRGRHDERAHEVGREHGRGEGKPAGRAEVQVGIGELDDAGDRHHLDQVRGHVGDEAERRLASQHPERDHGRGEPAQHQQRWREEEQAEGERHRRERERVALAPELDRDGHDLAREEESGHADDRRPRVRPIQVEAAEHDEADGEHATGQHHHVAPAARLLIVWLRRQPHGFVSECRAPRFIFWRVAPRWNG